MTNRTGKRIWGAGVLVLSSVLLLTSVVAATRPENSKSTPAPGQATASDPTEVIEVLGYEVARERVAVPEDWGAPLTKQLKVQAAYNNDEIVFRAQFPANKPGIHHDYLVYQGGKWVRHGTSAVGSVPDYLYEDRFAFHVDDGAVRGFANFGCSVACHSDLRHPFMYAAPESGEVESNSYYGDVINKSDTRKYIVESRRAQGEWWDVAWDDISSEDADFVAGLKEAGVLLDQWHWRAARGSPIGFSDDMWVLDYRNADGGRSSYSTNFDSEAGLPKFMFDPAKAGFAALSFDEVRNQRIATDQIYYLSPDLATDFDPNHAWQEGDAIPRRYLRLPEASRSDITSEADWADGWWTVELRRKLDTEQSDDKAFQEFRSYNLAFAFYTNGTGNRFHYVTFPAKLALGQKADIQAVRFDGPKPDWPNVPLSEFTAFYPGQASWQFLTSDRHPGAPAVRSDSASCASCHTPEGLAQLSVSQELRDEQEGPRLWTWTGGLLGVIGIALGGIMWRRN